MAGRIPDYFWALQIVPVTHDTWTAITMASQVEPTYDEFGTGGMAGIGIKPSKKLRSMGRSTWLLYGSNVEK
jgi:hypothetical protein